MNNNLGALRLDVFGFAAILQLVKLRVGVDVGAMSKQIEGWAAKKMQAMSGSPGSTRDAALDRCERKEIELRKRRQKAVAWLDSWLVARWADVDKMGYKDRQQIDVARSADMGLLRERLGSNADSVPKRFIVLQEAIMIPLYYEGDEGVEPPAEINRNRGLEEASTQMGFSPSRGAAIEQELDRFLKGAAGFWKRIFWTAILGVMLAAVCAPAVGAVIGSAMGLHGAAAFSAGLALLGGGSLAAGGVGMAGGFAVLVCGGALLGASAAGGLASLSAASPEFVRMSVAKIYNYMKFLREQDTDAAKEAYDQLVEAVIKTKSDAERIMLSRRGDGSQVKQLVKTLHYMVDQVSEGKA